MSFSQPGTVDIQSLTNQPTVKQQQLTLLRIIRTERAARAAGAAGWHGSGRARLDEAQVLVRVVEDHNPVRGIVDGELLRLLRDRVELALLDDGAGADAQSQEKGSKDERKAGHSSDGRNV